MRSLLIAGIGPLAALSLTACETYVGGGAGVVRSSSSEFGPDNLDVRTYGASATAGIDREGPSARVEAGGGRVANETPAD